MKRLLIAALVVSVAGAALAASPQPSLSKQHKKPLRTNLAKTLVQHPAAPAQPMSTATLGTTAPVNPAKAGAVVTPLRRDGHMGTRPQVKVPDGMIFASAAEAEYFHLKTQGLPIPASLVQDVFGSQPQGGARNGGETFATATTIPFSVGSTYTDAGTTVGYADNVLTGQTPPASCNTSFFSTSSFGAGDAVYTFTLPGTYMVGASTCNNATYDSCLGIFNANGALVGVNDDGTGCSGFSSVIAPCALTAGTYYVVVDGYGTATGTYTLSVTFSEFVDPGDPCSNPTVLSCGDFVTGSTIGQPNYVGNAAPDVFYEAVVTQSGPVTFHLRDAATDYDSYIRLYDGCPTDGGVELAFDDDSCADPGLASSITIALEPGTYYVVVEGYSAGAGNYGLTMQCSTCDPVACTGNDEGEPNSGPADFGGDDTYGTVECVDGGYTICGTTFTDDVAGTRDTDWFELFLLESSVLTITSEAEMFNPLIFVIDESYNILYSADLAGFCEGETITTDCLFPGIYYLWMGHNSFSGVPEEQNYSMTLNCQSCEIVDPCLDPVVLTCGSNAVGNTNDGFNYVGNAALDIFYQVDIAQSGPVTFSLCDGGTDYDSYLRLYDACPIDGGVELASNDDACGLQSELVVALTPGTYWLVVEGFGSGAGNYSLNVVCSTCDPVACTGNDEGEPNSGPADFGGDDTFGTVECEDGGYTICGTTFTDDVTGTRDTDWFELFLLEPSILTITSEAEMFDPLIFVIDEAYNILFSADMAGFCEGETITTDCLESGIYYLWMGHNAFSGVPEEQNYSLTLNCETCEPILPCENTFPIACGDAVTGDNSMSLGNSWDTYCNGGEDGPEVIYELTHSGGFLTINMDSADGEDLDMVLLGSCDPADCLDMPWAVGPTETISGVYAAGTYYIVVDAYAWTGADYSFTLDVTCGDDPCADLPPVNCNGTAEVEPNEGWNDDNASYNEITCGETMCGSTWATGGIRDLDWYHFTHTGGDLQVDTQIGAFDCVLFLTDFDTAGGIIASADNEVMCVAETMFVPALAAGEYYIVIAHTDFEGVDTDQDYALTLTCFGDPCEGHEPIACDGTSETEPNEGWNDENASYNEITDGETVCGTVWADADNRDLDWFHFTVSETANVTITSEIDWFDAILFLTQFDFNGSIMTAADANGACTGEQIIYECLEAGEYYAVIAHNDFNGVPEDQNYSLTLQFSTCTPTDPCGDMVSGGTLNNWYIVNRPAPVANHHNAANGCTGISSAGYDELHQLTLAAETDLQVVMLGQGSADEAVYILTDCLFTESCIAGVDAGGSDTIGETLTVQNVPAGTYYIVADYWGSAETHPFTLTVRNLGTDMNETLPLGFALEQNFPNPFNPTTTISWTQPALMPASLAIYNLAGAMVQEFNLGFRGAGTQTFTWNASELSSGVYFYSLTTGGQTLTQKAVLVK